MVLRLVRGRPVGYYYAVQTRSFGISFFVAERRKNRRRKYRGADEPERFRKELKTGGEGLGVYTKI